MGKFSYIVTRAFRFTEGAAQGNGLSMAQVRPDDQLWNNLMSGRMISAGPAVIKGFDQLRAPAVARFMFMIFSRMLLIEAAASPDPEP